MILKMQSKDHTWFLYDDIITLNYQISHILGKKPKVKYEVMRRRGFDFKGETEQTLYILNDDGKTIEKIL